MKNKLTIAALVLTILMGLFSCASQRFGCPNNPQANTRFKG